MKKHYLFTLMLLAGGLISSAQSKLDFQGQRELKQYMMQKRMDAEKVSVPQITTYSDENVETTVLLKLEDGYTVADLEAQGVKIVSQQDDLVIVSMPIDKVQKFSEIDAVKKMTFGSKVYAKNDSARAATKIASLQTGFGWDQAYKGTGVVVGLYDTGLDPNHITFKNGSKLRVQRVWTFDEYGLSQSLETPEAIASFSTETKYATHGTHVLGVMAGSYNSTTNKYYGVATGADIAIACGTLSMNSVLSGLDKIASYAEAENKPAVINVSLGVNTGPHDGTDLTSQYLSKLGERAILCLSAGNEGTETIALRQSFTSTEKDIKSFVTENSSEYDGIVVGQVEFWGADNSEFTVKAFIYDIVGDTMVYELPANSKSTNEKFTYVASPGYYEDGTGDLKDANFEKAFTGYMGLASAVDEDNNRYQVFLDYYMFETAANNGNYVLGFKVEGNPGQKVYGYCDGIYSKLTSHGLEGWNPGTSNGSISGLVCGDNVISVGAYATRTLYPAANGSKYYYPDLLHNGNPKAPSGNMLPFTSYGTLLDNTTRPHVCAPGYLISSYSGPYMEYAISQGVGESGYSASQKSGTKTHYWGVMTGTSQASPFAAGVIALWLQADPTLKFDDIVKIIEETSIKDDYVATTGVKEQWGHGKINPVDGIKYILDMGGVESVFADENRLMVNPIGENQYEVFVAGETSLNVVVYNMSGQPVIMNNVNGDTATLDVDNLSNGVYVVAVQGQQSRYTKRILVN